MDTNNETQEIKLRHWAEVIHECKSSGLTDKEWMNQHGIRRNQFYYWQRQLRAKALAAVRNNETDSQTVSLVDVTHPVQSAASQTPVTISTPAVASGTMSLVPLSVRIADAVIEVGENTSPELFRMVVRELRHAQ